MLDLLAFAGDRQKAAGRGSARSRRALVLLSTIAVEAAGLWLRTGRLAGNVVVRCRRGHLFTTIWIPAVSIKSLRLGFWRIQRCPVGHHCSLVTPVNDSELTDEQRHDAAEQRALRLPCRRDTATSMAT